MNGAALSLSHALVATRHCSLDTPCREIGTIVRYLGLCPTELELRNVIEEIREEEPTGFIRFEKFERMMSRIMLENQYPRDSEDKLLRAFRTLDTENKGFVEAEKLRNLLTTHGERFSQEEIDEFLNFAVGAASRTVPR